MQISNRKVSSSSYKWWVYGAVAVGMFVTVMDQSGVNIAIPKIADYFSVDIPTVQWIILGYVLSTAVMLMPMGRLSDIVGRKPVYLSGFVIFMISAAAGGLSNSFFIIVVAKIVQGLGAAAIQANGLAMIAHVFPEDQRGKGMGMYMAIIGTGSISGPILSGILVTSFGWRSVFYSGIPLGLLAIGLALAVLRADQKTTLSNDGRLAFDWLGAALSSASLTSFLLGVTNGHRLGWNSSSVVFGLIFSVFSMLMFLWWENRTDDPMLDLNFFRNKAFSMGVVARFLSFLAGSSIYFLMPFYLIVIMGYPANRAGFMMVPASLAMAVVGPVSGTFIDRFGTRWFSVGGMLLLAISLSILTNLTLNSSWFHVLIGMSLYGAGMGAFSSSNTTAVMASMDRERYGIVSAFLNMTRTTANVSGVVIATTFVTLTMSNLGYEPSLAAVSGSGSEGIKDAFVLGLRKAYLAGLGFVLLGVIVSAVRGEPGVSGGEHCPDRQLR